MLQTVNRPRGSSRGPAPIINEDSAPVSPEVRTTRSRSQLPVPRREGSVTEFQVPNGGSILIDSDTVKVIYADEDIGYSDSVYHAKVGNDITIKVPGISVTFRGSISSNYFLK